MWNLRKVITFVVLGAMILGAVFVSSLVGCKEEGEKMAVKNDGLVPSGDIPAIDASAPVRIETATFALG